MSRCSIFNKPILADVTSLDTAEVSLSWLGNMIPEYNTEYSGIWRPLFISASNSQSEYAEPLMFARSKQGGLFDPCNCEDNSINIDPLDSNSIAEYNSCNYCGNYNTTWQLYDSDGNSSPAIFTANCCSGACDTKLKQDDYMPKIPVLNQAYITGMVDYKYHKQFPACNNPGMGKERFITIKDGNRNKIKGADLCIDWKLKEQISEVQYDITTTTHDSKYLHDKSYNKSKMVSKTCGNFILLSLNSGLTDLYYQTTFPIISGLIGCTGSGEVPLPIVPSIAQFQDLPHGIDQEKYKNIFIKNQKLGSFWKWNYMSGILCWYRYYDINRSADQRPIAGIDLYIPEGDVFFAQNDGPEPFSASPTGVNNSIKNCPSGLKIMKNSNLECIIPSGSEFAYISANIYPKFYSIYSTLIDSTPTYLQAFKIAATLATSPSYDQITVDLLKYSNSRFPYDRNEFEQIDILNKHMQTTTDFDSVSRLNYISNKAELINTLANKYGAYLWIPPKSTTDITFNQSINASFGIDLDFDMVIKKKDSTWSSNSCAPIQGCYDRTLTKNFSYNQRLGFSNTMLSTYVADHIRYSTSCSNGEVSEDNHALYSSVYLNNSLIKSVVTSSGCVIFEDTYPRISTSDTKTYCSSCDTNSSFYLIPDAETSVCGSLNEDESFCYATLARRFNNSPKQFPSDTQRRPERRLADGTVRFRRAYKSLFFNPHIDLIAFHSQGGIVVDSKPFQLNTFAAFERNSSASIDTQNITLGFITQDVGIKLYGISAEYLQTSQSSTYRCKRFPVVNSCQCLPISVDPIRPISCDNPNPTTITQNNIFTPALSTRISPRLQKYGGYNSSYLDSIFGSNTLAAGGSLPVLTTQINPINPYGCDSEVSTTLYNYTNTSWELELQNFATHHADVLASVTENVNFLQNRYTTILYSDFTVKELRPNLDYKRFTTKTTINGKSLYNKQTDTIFQKGSSLPAQTTVQLQNPFLESLLLIGGGESGLVLYPPSGELLNAYSFNGSLTPQGDFNRGDESSQVVITFIQKYRKQILSFKIPAPTPMGTLTKGFFHPNKGLTSNITDKTPIKNNKIYYDSPLNTDSMDDFDNGACYFDTLSNRSINAIRSITEFQAHKKLRLYLLINNKWYEYLSSNLGSYVVNNNRYIGSPILYEYLSDESRSLNLPSVLPTTPKEHISFNYIYNDYGFKHGFTNPNFPIKDNKIQYNRNNPKELIIPGIRTYFMIPEIDNVFNTQLESMDDIDQFEAPESLTYGQSILFNDGTRWICINPSSPNTRSSYIYSNFGYLYHNFSDLHIDFSNITRNGYVYNSAKPCYFPVAIYNPKLKIFDVVNTVAAKQLRLKLVNKNGRPIRNLDEETYMIPYTVLTMTLDIKNQDYEFLDLLSDNTKNMHSFIISNITVPLSESDTKLLNSAIPSKWGDVVYYDGKILDPYTDAIIDINEIYPDTSYDNDFFKIIVNNHQELTHRYKITFQDQSFKFSHNDLVYYNILQKYNLGELQPYSLQTDKYHNYLPFMQLSLLSDQFSVEEQNTAFTEAIKSSKTNNTPLTGTLQIGGILRNKISAYESGYYSPDTATRFWINLDANNLLARSAFVPAQTIYSDTLRIDDPPYWLSRTTSQEISVPLQNSGETCRATFKPQNISLYNSPNNILDNSTSYTFTNTKRTFPFQSYDIYCDLDDNTCSNALGCFSYNGPGMANVGSINLYSHYKIGVNKTISIPDNVPYLISYDAGIYNVIGNDSYIGIHRSELPPINDIELNDIKCNNNSAFPTNYKSSSINPMYQQALNQTDTVVPHDTDVANMDLVANEMLFRILYGENQRINKDMLLVDNTIFTKNDLIKYTTPRIEAKDIYSQILYNYDTQAPMRNLFLNGSFTIRGVRSVGSSTTIRIGNILANFNIIKEQGVILVVGNINGQNVRAPIHTEYYDEKNYIIQSWPADQPEPSEPEAPNAATKITYQGNCDQRGSYQYGTVAFTDGGDPAAGSNLLRAWQSSGEILDLTVSKPSYMNAQESYSAGGEGGQCCGFLLPTCCIPTIAELKPRWYGLQYVCGQPTYGSVNVVPALTEPITYPCLPGKELTGQGNCSVFEIGYCRKRNCSFCEVTIEDINEINFEYEFEDCKTKFTLFGHAYRQIHNTSLPTQRRLERQPDDCSDGFGDACEGYPVIDSVKNREDFIKNNSVTGFAVTLGQCEPSPDAPLVPKCTAVIGSVGQCAEDTVGCRICSCDPCGFVSPPGCVAEFKRTPDSPLEPCTYCWRGSYFRSPTEGTHLSPGGWPSADYCANNQNWCGVVRLGSRNVETYRKIFLQETRSTNPYNPLCASALVRVDYTSKSVIVTMQETSETEPQIFCFSTNLTNCPNISISSNMSQLSVDDAITSNCNECQPNPVKINVVKKSQPFMVKKIKALCIVDTVYTADVNPDGVVSKIQSWRDGDTPIGHHGYYHRCNGGLPVEYGCFEWGQILYDWPEDLFMQQTIECAIPLPGTIPTTISKYVLDEKEWDLTQKAKIRFAYLGTGYPNLPEEDIIEGIVPGTVSEIKRKSYVLGGSTRTRAGISKENILTGHVFYYEYDYIRPVTVQDILRNDEELICTQNNYQPASSVENNLLSHLMKGVSSTSSYTGFGTQLGSCYALPYPVEFSYNFSQYDADTIFTWNKGNIAGSSYVRQNPEYVQNSDCDSGMRCDYKHNVYICRPSVGDEATPDICCLADLRVVNNYGARAACGSTQTYAEADSGYRQNPLWWTRAQVGRPFDHYL